MILLKRNINVFGFRWLGLVFLLMFFSGCDEENIYEEEYIEDWSDSLEIEDPYLYDYFSEKTQEEELITKPLVSKERVFEDDFKEKYTKKKAFDYTESPSKWKLDFESQIEPNAWFFNLDLQSVIIYPLAIGLVLFLLYFLLKNFNFNWEYFKTDKTKVILETTEDEILDTSEADLMYLIEKAKKEENWSIAIRFYYNFLLQKLREKDLIKWNKEKTNRDYLLEIKDDTLKSQFSQLSYYFDWVYYGQFSIDKKNFLKAEEDFLKTIQTL